MADLVPHLRIAHQIPGRVRLKLAAGALLSQAWRACGDAGLGEMLAALPGVRAIAFNPAALSCVVEYDNAAIPDAAWPDLLAARATPAADALRGLLTAAAPPSHSNRLKEKSP